MNPRNLIISLSIIRTALLVSRSIFWPEIAVGRDPILVVLPLLTNLTAKLEATLA